MRVIIFGATGGIGRHAVEHALDKGYQVTAYVRSPEKLAQTSPRLRVVQGEIFDYQQVEAAVRGQDAVIWCVGIPMKRSYPTMHALEGHRVLLRAMKACGVKRLVDWATPSVPFAGDRRSFVTVVPGLLAGLALTSAKREMVEIGKLVESSDLEWTLVRFIAPTDGPYTGAVKVSFGRRRMRLSVARADIGAFMVEQVERTEYIRSMPIIGS